MTIMMLGIMAVVAFVGGGIVDYMSIANQKHALQGVADRAAIAAAQELIVARNDDARISSVASSFVDANYARTHTTNAAIIEDGKAVQVTIAAKPQT
jgi:Flp pilus assembly protein TadG